MEHEGAGAVVSTCMQGQVIRCNQRTCSIGDAKVTIEKRGLRGVLEGLRPKEACCDSISVFRGDMSLRWWGFVSL